MQLRVLSFGYFQDRNVGVGVLPQSQELFVCAECREAGSVGIAAVRSSGFSVPRYVFSAAMPVPAILRTTIQPMYGTFMLETIGRGPHPRF